MIQAELVFTKFNGRKKYSLTITNQEQIQTVFQQFVLSLPLGTQAKDLYIHQMNNCVLSNDEVISFNNTYKMFIDIEHDHPELLNEINHLLFSKKKLQITLPVKNVFTIQHAYCYILEKTPEKYHVKKKIAKITKTNDDFLDLPMHVVNLQNHVDTLFNVSNERSNLFYIQRDLSIQQYLAKQCIKHDLKTIQREAGQATTAYTNLRDGIESTVRVNKNATIENFKLKTKLNTFQTENKQEKQLIRNLKHQYGPYLQTDQQRLAFINALITNCNSPNVLQLVNNSIDNLYAIIRAITKMH